MSAESGGQSAEMDGVTEALVAALVRDHIGCDWLSDGTDVRWSCGIVHPGPIHMQPTARDHHVAALVIVQVEADRAMKVDRG